jgi:hypothetical protein
VQSDAAPAAENFDIADELAALNRFRLIEELAPEFHEKHWQRIAFITVTVSSLAQQSPDLQLIMGVTAGHGHDDAANAIRGVLRQLFEEAPERALWIHQQLEQPLRSAILLGREAAAMPEWLEFAMQVIRAGMIEASGPGARPE